MREIHETLLYIAYNLTNHNQSITLDAVRQSLEWMLREDLDLEKEMNWLSENGFFLINGEKGLSLSEKGKKEAFRINASRTRDDFNRLIYYAVYSTAYLDFCEEIYGYRIYLFNMMDKQQLNYLFHTVPISKNDSILDLGCGSGGILNNLVNKYACQGTGIDQLGEAAVNKCSPMIFYIYGDMDALEDHHVNSTLTLAIDSLYFSKDLDRLVKLLKGIEHNRLYLYYSQYIFDEAKEDKTLLERDHTRLATILRNNELPYKVIDYSANECALYENALKILPRYKKAMAGVKNGDLYESRLRENRIGKEMYDKGLASRYLYIVE